MPPPVAHIHAIGTALPPHDVHQCFVDWADGRIAAERERALFRRMAARSGIAHRWSVLPPESFDPGGFYGDKADTPTAARMALYAEAAPALALAAIADLDRPLGTVTHLVVASCTGFTAPGLDQIIAEHLGLPADVERTLVGFMGCYAAVSALRVAHHIVRSTPGARVLVVNVELSTLHLQPDPSLEPLLAQLQFADGAAAALVSADADGLACDNFFAATLPDSAGLIRWEIGDTGFVMHLSGAVPGRIVEALSDPAIRAQLAPERTDAWAVHPGGRSILDAVAQGLALGPDALATSRDVLRRAGNMSSATLMFVLRALMDAAPAEDGCALAFGPGVAAEGFRFRHVR